MWWSELASKSRAGEKKKDKKVRNRCVNVGVLPTVAAWRTAVAGGGGGGALVETGIGDPSHLTSKESEWKFPSAM